MAKKGSKVVINVAAIEFVEGGNTLWVHGPDGGTVFRLKCVDPKTGAVGKITSSFCKTSPVSHADALVSGDIAFCIAKKR